MNATPKRKLASPKSRRDSLDRRIAEAKTNQEQKRVVLRGQAKPSSRIQDIVDEWRLVIYWRDHPEDRPKKQCRIKDQDGAVVFDKDHCTMAWDHAMKSARNFIRDVMLNWDVDALVALAREMKRAVQAKSWTPDPWRWHLLNGMSVNKLAQHIVEESFSNTPPQERENFKNKELFQKRMNSTVRTLRRFKARWRKM
jgi:hypothetical protein